MAEGESGHGQAQTGGGLGQERELEAEARAVEAFLQFQQEDAALVAIEQQVGGEPAGVGQGAGGKMIFDAIRGGAGGIPGGVEEGRGGAFLADAAEQVGGLDGKGE